MDVARNAHKSGREAGFTLSRASAAPFRGRSVGAAPRFRRHPRRQKELISRYEAKASDGLEPSSPSLLGSKMLHTLGASVRGRPSAFVRRACRRHGVERKADQFSELETCIAAWLIARVRPSISISGSTSFSMSSTTRAETAPSSGSSQRPRGCAWPRSCGSPEAPSPWESNCFPHGSPFVVELPAGALAPPAVSRLVDAARVVAVALSLRRPVDRCATPH